MELPARMLSQPWALAIRPNNNHWKWKCPPKKSLTPINSRELELAAGLALIEAMGHRRERLIRGYFATPRAFRSIVDIYRPVLDGEIAVLRVSPLDLKRRANQLFLRFCWPGLNAFQNAPNAFGFHITRGLAVI